MKTFQKPLSHREELEYLKLLKGSDPVAAKLAKEVLIERNLRLVAHIVKKYQSGYDETEDLISTGCIGLIKAIDTFDAGKGRLATYACRCIDNELLMLFRNKKKTSREVSLFSPIGQDKEGNEICLVDIIEQNTKDIIDELYIRQKTGEIYKLIDENLNDREKKVIFLRYGLMGYKETTQNEIAGKLNISRSYVSRIEKKALEKLKAAFDNKRG